MDFLVHLGQSAIEMVWNWIIWIIDTLGYWGIAFLMAIESFNVPLPSEMILTSAGVMVHDGKFNLHLASLFGAIGCVLGSVPSYWIGYVGGRPFVKKYGKWFLVSEHDLDTAQVWCNKYGDWAFFVCRMLPVIRTFVSLPAGVLKNNFWRFTALTFIGSLVWSYFLVWMGVIFANNLEAFKHMWHKFDYLIVGIIFVLGVLYVWKHVKHFQEADRASKQG